MTIPETPMMTPETADVGSISASDASKSAREVIIWRLVATGALAIFLALAIGYSYTRAPWWDEGVFADVAVTFARHGHLGSQILAPQGYRDFPQADRYTYWQFPLYLLSLGLWFRALPETAQCMRLLSVLWGCVYLFSWCAFVRGLSENEPLSLFVPSVIALDYACLSAASDGRMDMMCCALGMAGLASFACLRKKNWSLAVFAAACFGAASLSCHPMGALMNLMLLAVIVLNRDGFERRAIAYAAVPYVLAVLLYGLYVAQAPSIFFAQSRSNAEYRVTTGWSLIHNFLNDFRTRYLGYYFTNLEGMNKLKIASLVFGVAGVAGLAFTRELRSQPFVKTLLALTAIGYCGVALLDNQKIPGYFIYTLPFMTACGAVLTFHYLRQKKRFVAAALATLPVISGLGGFLYKIRLNEYKNLYLPAIAAIRSNVKPSGIVMGGAELAFALGFNQRLVDDRSLGLATGITPDAYVVNAYYGAAGPVAQFRDTRLRTSYHMVFSNHMYQVYLRNSSDSVRITR